MEIINTEVVKVTEPNEVFVAVWRYGYYNYLYSQFGRDADLLREEVENYTRSIGTPADKIVIFKCLMPKENK